MTHLECRFVNMVLPGMVLMVGASKVTRDAFEWSVDFDVQIRDGGAAITRGRLTGS